MPRATQERTEPGILGRIGDAAHAFLTFFQVRTQLLALEAREGIHLLKVNATLLSIGLVLMFLGYVGAWAAVISLLARKWNSEWEILLLWVASPHLFVGAVLVWRTWERLFQPLFDSTLEELEKDQQWIRESLSADGRRMS